MAPTADYSGTPLLVKLGVKEGSVVGLLGAPAGFDKTFGELPDGATIRRQARGLGLASGLVANKVCAVDEAWSGLRFMRRRKPAGR